jgi:P4 family phage/plasmid primase-like protien
MIQKIQDQLNQTFNVSFFTTHYSNAFEAKELAYGSFRKKFSVFQERATKEAVSLWSPARFVEGSTRSIATTVELCAITLDFDNGNDWSDFIDEWKSKGYAFWVHNTYSHTVKKPKWRAVFPLLKPCPKEEWSMVWERAASLLGHNACDVSASDAPRIYWLPGKPLGLPKDSHQFLPFDGDFIDWRDLLPEEESEPAVVTNHQFQNVSRGSSATYSGLSPNDDFDNQATWDELLIGWEKIKTVDGLTHWKRPGKKEKTTSATTGNRPMLGGDRMYCFSSNAGLPTSTYLKKSAVYAFSFHNGDFSKSAAELSQKGYGERTLTTSKAQVSSTLVNAIGNDASIDWDFETMFTDLGNARRFVADWGEDLRYVVESKEWARWNGKRWEVGAIATSTIQALAIKSAEMFAESNVNYADNNTRIQIIKWSQKSVSSGKLKSCIELAANMLAVSLNDFDNHPSLLNTQDGIVNVDTGELMPHDKTKLMVQITNCGYNTSLDARPTMFSSFLKKIIVDDDTRLFLLKWLGYGFTGYTHDQTFLFSYGASGANGKSTLFNLIEWMAGSYATTMDQSAIMSNKGFATNTYELAKLVSKRWVTVAEIGDGRFNEQLLKVLTGGDMMTARQVYEKAVEFQPVLKLAMFGNHKPIISQEASTWRRVRLIDFNVTIPEEERDAKLGEKLRGEASIILAYLIGAYRMSKEQGMKPSALMTNDAEEYKEENNILQLFFDEKLRFSSVATVMVSSMHKEYLEWARERNATLYNPTSFGRIIATPLLQRGCSKRRTNEGIRWAGVEIGGI